MGIASIHDNIFLRVVWGIYFINVSMTHVQYMVRLLT